MSSTSTTFTCPILKNRYNNPSEDIKSSMFIIMKPMYSDATVKPESDYTIPSASRVHIGSFNYNTYNERCTRVRLQIKIRILLWLPVKFTMGGLQNKAIRLFLFILMSFKALNTRISFTNMTIMQTPISKNKRSNTRSM